MATALPYVLAGPAGTRLYGGRFGPARVSGNATADEPSAAGGLESLAQLSGGAVADEPAAGGGFGSAGVSQISGDAQVDEPTAGGGMVVAGTDDWPERSTDLGVVLADPLNTTTKMVPTNTISATQWVLNNGTADHVSLSPNDGWRFAVLNSDTTSRGEVGIFFGNLKTFGPGETLWLVFEEYAPPEFAWAPWKYNTASGGGSHKSSILSDSAGSNRPNEIVVQQNFTANQWNGYWQDGVSTSVLTDVGIDTSALGGSNSDIRRQPGIDRGLNPLVGVNPDTGAAWTAYQQTRARYGLLYNAQSSAEFARGHGDPFSGGARQVPNEWNAIIMRVAIGNWGAANSRWTLWRARQGQAPELIHDVNGITLGSGPAYNTLWLPPYVSDGQAGGRKVASRTGAIPGISISGAAGLSTPIGAGLLEYNAATGRVRWQGFGEAYGTARGFSAANGILTRTVKSSNADSYLVVTADPALLPSSGISTETVTIADGRPDTWVDKRRVIISRRTIKAPGGFVPTTGALQAASAGMTSGQWLNASSLVTGLGVFTGGVGASGSRLTYGFRFERDEVNRRWLIYMSDHSEDGRFVIFNEATGAFTVDHIPSWAAGFTGTGLALHPYCHPVYIQKTGKYYMRNTQSTELRRWDGGTTWTVVDIPNLFYNTAAAGHCYHEALDRLLICQLENGTQGSIVGMNVDTGAWQTYADQTLFLADITNTHNFAVYNRNSQIAWMGGGTTDAGPPVRQTYTMNAAASVQAADLIPTALGSIGPSGSFSLAVPNPANGNFIVIRDGSTWYDFDATTRAFSVRSGSSFPGPRLADSDPAAGGMAGTSACPIYEWGVIALLNAYSRTQPAQLWLYKP